MRLEVLKYLGAALEAAGQPFAEGIGVDCEDLIRGRSSLDRPVHSLDMHAMVETGVLSYLTAGFGQAPVFALTAKGVAMARRVYLPEAAREAARKIIRDRIGKRRGEFQRAVIKVRSEMASRGLIRSSIAVGQIRELIAKQLEERLAVVIEVWAGIANKSGFELGGQWRELVQFALDAAITDSEDLAALYRAPIPSFDVPGPSWEVCCATALTSAEAEIEAVIHLEPEGGALLMADELNIQNITGPVGAVLAGGRGHQVSVHQKTGPIDYAAGLPHLEAFTDLLQKAAVAGDARAAEPLETALAALAEARKPAPNGLTLGALLAGLHHAVSTVGAWPGALDALRAAAVAWGIHLP